MRHASFLALAGGVLLPLAVPVPAAGADVLAKVRHVVVLYQENRSFDGHGRFPGANGLAGAGDIVRQVDRGGRACPPSATGSTPGAELGLVRGRRRRTGDAEAGLGIGVHQGVPGHGLA